MKKEAQLKQEKIPLENEADKKQLQAFQSNDSLITVIQMPCLKFDSIEERRFDTNYTLFNFQQLQQIDAHMAQVLCRVVEEEERLEKQNCECCSNDEQQEKSKKLHFIALTEKSNDVLSLIMPDQLQNLTNRKLFVEFNEKHGYEIELKKRQVKDEEERNVIVFVEEENHRVLSEKHQALFKVMLMIFVFCV